MGEKLHAYIIYVETIDDLFRVGVCDFSLEDAVSFAKKEYMYGDESAYHIVAAKPIEETQVGLCFCMSEILYIFKERPKDKWFERIVLGLYDTAVRIKWLTGRSLADLGFYELFNIEPEDGDEKETLALMDAIGDVMLSCPVFLHGLCDYEIVKTIANRIKDSGCDWDKSTISKAIGDFMSDVIECNYKLK